MTLVRILLLILLLSGKCFGQFFDEIPDLRFPGNVDSILLGNWQLKESIIVPAYRYDSIPIIRENSNQKKTITFTQDSLIINPYPTRYYQKYESYKYVLDDSELQLFQGDKKKRKQVGSYTILKYSPRELVISTQEVLDDPFDFNTITVYHVYYRKEMNENYKAILSKLLNNKWINCSNQYIPFLTADTSVQLDFKTKGMNLYQNDSCTDSIYHIEIAYDRDEYNFQNILQIYFSRGNIAAGIASTRFYFDENLENIIIMGEDILVYKIILFDTDQFTLKLNNELTNQFNKEYP